MKVLLSIKPEYVEQIFNGQKRFEYRKILFKDPNVSTVIVYSTMPIGKIVGEFNVKQIHRDKPSKLWSKTKQYSGVAEEFYNKYFIGKTEGYAIEIDEPFLYEQPIDPKEIVEGFVPPQSFFYFGNFDNIIADKIQICIIRSVSKICSQEVLFAD